MEDGAIFPLLTVVKFTTSVPLIVIVNLGVQLQKTMKADGEYVKVIFWEFNINLLDLEIAQTNFQCLFMFNYLVSSFQCIYKIWVCCFGWALFAGPQVWPFILLRSIASSNYHNIQSIDLIHEWRWIFIILYSC